MSDSIYYDPLGRAITLHARTWYGHILKGHPELELYRDAVETALRNPAEIRISRSQDSGRQYYSTRLDNGLIVVVVVDIELMLVKTAYLTKKVKGGNLEWSQQTPSKEP